MDEHRTSDRRRTLKGAKALLSSSTLVDCTLSDVSDAGAQLKFAGPTPLPPAFMLRIVSSGIEMHVELAWQRGLSAGVRFDTPAVPAG